MLQRKFIIAAVLLLCASHPAHADKVFAHSKSLSMSFTALGDPWCGPDVKMQVAAADAGKFDTPDYTTIIRKLGHVLTQECPDAKTLAITGVTDDATVWTGSAARSDGWVAQKAAGETQAAAESGAAVEPAAATASAAAPVPEEPASREEPARVEEAEGETVAAEPAVVAEPPEETAQAAPATQTGPEAAEPAVAEPAAPLEAPVPAPVMEIAGWKPGGPTTVSGSAAGSMKEITAQDTGCRIRTLVEVNDSFKPSFKMNRDYECVDGYAKSSNLKRQDTANLYYEGQKQPFTSLSGFWADGYNLQSGFPRQIVSVYDTGAQQQAGYGYRAPAAVKMLVWAGEDRELRTHYFATYNHTGGQWRPDGITHLIVVTDNEEVKNNPDKTTLASSLAEAYREFYGYKDTNRFNNVSFFVTDRIHKTPGQTYQLALREANPDASLYKAGRAIRQRGTPWMIQVQTDFGAKREAFRVAEQQRLEAERQRQAQLRARHQASLDKQYQQLAAAPNYDRVRFYTTLMLDGERVKNSRIDFNTSRAYYGNALDGAVMLSHPAQYIDRVNGGHATLGAPMYMLVEADDGEIEKPYPMIVTRSDAAVELDDWVLVKTGPEFGYRFDDDGKPVFEITVTDAITCKTEKCLNEMDAATMMKNWYDDDDMEFAAVSEQ